MPTIAANRKPKPALQAPVVTTRVEMPPPESPAPAEQPQASQESSLQRFLTYMKELTPKEWESHIVYLTREQPKTSINGVGGYLTKLQQPFDLEDVKAAYGGQEFSYVMKGPDNKIVFGGRFRIEAPPKLDPQREAAPSGSTNGGGASARTEALLEQLVNDLRERGRADGNDPATAAAIAMMSSAATKAMDMVKGQVPTAESPTGAIKEMVSALKEMGIIAAPTTGGWIKELLAFVQSPMIAPLLTRLLTPADPVAQFDQLGKLVTALDAIRGEGAGGGEGRPKDWKALAVERGLEALPRVLEAIENRRAANGGVPQFVSMRTASALPTAPVTPGAPPAANGGLRTVPIDHNNFSQDASAGAVPPKTEPSAEELAAIADSWLKDKIVEMVFVGMDGEQIMETVNVWRPQLVEDLAKFGETQVDMYFAADPSLARCRQHPNWPRTLTEALAAAREIVAELDEEPRAPAPVN